MTELQHRGLEERLRRYGRALEYPATPNLAASTFKGRAYRPTSGLQRLAWALTVVLLITVTLSVPSVRAQLVEWLQIGGVAIERRSDGVPEQESPRAATYALEDLSGETSLAEARAVASFPIILPEYPANLGDPDRVFLQSVDKDRQFVILAWGDEVTADLVLYVIGPGVSLTKGAPQTITEVSIDGRPGAYLEGPHLLVIQGLHQFGVLVPGPALVWEGDNGLTYRLEADLALDDLILIAESIP